MCERDGVELAPTAVPGKLVEELFEHHVISTFTGPTFVMDYPVDTSPLVRGHRSKPGVVAKWDLGTDTGSACERFRTHVGPAYRAERSGIE